MSARAWWITGCVIGLLSVVFGAFGAHGLEGRVEPEQLASWWEVGVRYAAYHALALLAVAWAASRAPSRAASVAGWAFVVGVALFSGSLLVMTLTGVRILGAVTPFGGLGLMTGWVALAMAGARALAPADPAVTPVAPRPAPEPARQP